MKAYVRVHQIKNPPSSSGMIVNVSINPKGAEMSCECSGSPLTCYKVFQLMCDDQYGQEGTIKIILQKNRLLRSPKDMAVLVLPFTWYEVDKTTRYEYPLKAVNKKAKDVMMDVEIHLASDPKTRAFDAPAGKLLCIPTWEVSNPQLKEDAPVSAYQPPSAPAVPAPALPPEYYQPQQSQSAYTQPSYPEYPDPQQNIAQSPYDQNENEPSVSPYQDNNYQSPYDYPSI